MVTVRGSDLAGSKVASEIARFAPGFFMSAYPKLVSPMPCGIKGAGNGKDILGGFH